MAPLTTAAHKSLPRGDFAVPSKAPGSGAYPIDTPNRARNALARSAGKPVAAKVKVAVGRKYPGIA